MPAAVGPREQRRCPWPQWVCLFPTAARPAPVCVPAPGPCFAFHLGFRPACCTTSPHASRPGLGSTTAGGPSGRSRRPLCLLGLGFVLGSYNTVLHWQQHSTGAPLEGCSLESLAFFGLPSPLPLLARCQPFSSDNQQPARRGLLTLLFAAAHCGHTLFVVLSRVPCGTLPSPPA